MQKNILSWLLLGVFVLSACGTPAPATPDMPDMMVPTETTPVVTPVAVASPTPQPVRRLTICLGSEPSSLFPLGNTSRAAQAVLAAVYDGPFEAPNFVLQSSLLERIPSVENGDVTLESVTVRPGDEVLDADGRPVTLDDGVRIRPAGCHSAECAVTYQRGQEFQMDRMAVTFHLRSDLRWADGEPLTAYDSVYTWGLMRNPDLYPNQYLPDRTADYRALDAETVVWTAKPGFIDPTYADNLAMPLPEHAWEALSPAELPDAAISAREPLGWGAYVITEWQPGTHILLRRNPIYAEDAPYFDEILFRFTPDPDQAIAALLDGACDVLDESIPLAGQFDLLRELADAGRVRLQARTGLTMEVLAIGIQPAAYDDGYQPGPFGDRPDYFSDARMRQALAFCLDRQRLVEALWGDLSSVPAGLVPEFHPLFWPGVARYPYSPEKGRALLDALGWKDLDSDPNTPLTAWDVAGISQGTPLTLGYWTTDSSARRLAVEIFRDSLAACGIALEPHFLTPEEFFRGDQDGPLFGRQFDLAQFAMGVYDLLPPCYWYASDAIPSAANNWLGTNVSGYYNETYDYLCRQAFNSLPDTPLAQQAWQQLQQLFAADLPVIPLYHRVQLLAARPDLCGTFLASGPDIALSQIESWKICSGEE